MLEPREPREDDNEHTTMLAMGGAVHRSNDKGQVPFAPVDLGLAHEGVWLAHSARVCG